MRITFDPTKRDKTLRERGLDFQDAAEVFAGPTINFVDDRRDYGEVRVITYGLLGNRLVALVWTGSAEHRRVISMRKANDREQATFRDGLR